MTRAAAAALVLVAVAAVAVAGCGSGEMTSQARPAPEFTRVRAEGAIDVVVQAGAPGRIVVRAGEKVLDDVVTEVEGDTLVVGTESRGLVIGPDGFGGARVVVDAPRLEGASSEGSSDLEVAGLEGGPLELVVEGSGDLRARGRVADLAASVEGSGEVDLSDLAANRVAVEVEGSGDADVHAIDALRAVVEGSGSISYRGNPRIEVARTEGSGDIERE